MSRFNYLIERIRDAAFSTDPYKHIWIEDFFNEDDFAEITAAREISLPNAQNDDELFDTLHDTGYQIINFPGCITNRKKYVEWHADKSERTSNTHSACEGFGITLRLYNPQTEILRELDQFMASVEFNRALAEKFDIDLEDCTIDGGIQKYLDGYEISPHPDIRKKALTFMVNINPHADSEDRNHHTRYLGFRPDQAYIHKFWEDNSGTERCWVPWDWCEVKKTQTANNSIVIFSPNNETLHAVKADYDHLTGQRTQLYGNLWYKNTPDLKIHEWEDFDGHRARGPKDLLPIAVRSKLRRAVRAVKSKSLGARNIR